MCGRLVRVWDHVLEQWVVHVDASWQDRDAVRRELLRSRYNLAPTEPVVVLTRPAHGPARLEVARWGFPVPGQAPSATAFNARAEDAAASPLWRGFVDGAHAVLPVTGFYEWSTRGAQRVPHFLRPRDGSPLLLAALVAMREVAGARRLCATVLTRPSQGAVRPLHDRMPAALAARDVDAWLRAAPGTFARLAQGEPVALEAREVSARVNRVGDDDPGLLAAVPRQAGLFES